MRTDEEEQDSMAWEVRNPIDYSASGDDIDTAAQKVKAEFEIVYQLLNRLRSNDATISANVQDPAPYQLHVNTSNGTISIRNGANTDWILLGKVDEHFGINAEQIGAITREGVIGKIYSGTSLSSRPATAQTYDLYYDMQNKRIYYYDGTAWQIFLSLQFMDISNYEEYCVLRSEVGYSGADKVLRLDKVTGKGNIDIAGSPDKLLGHPIEVSNLQDEDVLTYNAERQKFVNKARDTYEASYSAEPGHLILVDENRTIHVNVDGSVNRIQGVPVAAIRDRIRHGDVLVYSATEGKFIVAQKDYLQEIDITERGEIKKIPRVSTDGLLHVNISGWSKGLNGIFANTNGIEDGDVLVYRNTTGKFEVEPKGNTLGEGRSLVLYDGNEVLGEYNGSRRVEIDISNEFASSAISKLEWQIAEVALALKEATNKRAYITDAVIADLTQDVELIDATTVSITGIFATMQEIDVASIKGIEIGRNYTITDGTNSENVQVESIKYEDGKYRVKLKNAIRNYYADDGSAKLIRSNIQITNWLPMASVTWQEISSEEEISLEIDYTNGEDFQVFGGRVNSSGEIEMGSGDGTEYCLEYVKEEDSQLNFIPKYRWKRVNWTKTSSSAVTWSDY